MYGSSHSVSDLADGSGTINPAALNSDGTSNNHATAILPSPSLTATTTNTTTRGVKRSLSPDNPEDGNVDEDVEGALDDYGRRRRGRPPKFHRPTVSESPSSSSVPAPPFQSTHSAQPVQPVHIQTPQMQPQSLPQQSIVSPPLTSPPEKMTPTKTALVKALPTVRDHTTDQLNEGGDEFIPKEFDEAGETKVDADGYPQGGREYRCRTFRVPLRRNKLFMLATECARVLGYRDSYLLFNKNRSLHKIIASQIEKDDLIQQDVLPYSYRSRQIAIVSARSMFRQFGSRVIVNGRRVRDDYWENKALKQGFTEEDLAGDKRPGAAKARDAAAAAAGAANANLLPSLAQGDVIYSNNSLEAMPPGLPLGAGPSLSLAPLPMVHLATTTDDPRLREYTGLARSRQEMTGQPYQDKTQPSNPSDIMNQASHTADFNKILSSQRGFRQKGLEDFYIQQREASTAATLSQPKPEQSYQSQAQSQQQPQTHQQPQPQPGPFDSTNAASATRSLRSPQIGIVNSGQPQNIMPHQPSSMIPSGQAGFPRTSLPHAPSPIRGMHPGVRPDLMHRSSHSLPTGAAPTPPYGYPSQPQQQLWGQPPPQPQQMPVSGPQGVGMPHQYASQLHASRQSPSPLVHQAQQSQSPRNQQRPTPPPHMHQSFTLPPQVTQQPPMASMGFPGATAAGYHTLLPNRAVYPSTQGPAGQPFLAGNPQQPGLGAMPTMSAGGGIPGWASTPNSSIPPVNPAQDQSESPLGKWSGY